MPLKGYKQSEEHKKKLSLIRTGKIRIPHTEEVKKRISESNKGKHFDRIGKQLPVEHKRRISLALTGKHPTAETLIKLSLSHKGKRMGVLNNFWKGGITPLHTAIRYSVAMDEWRKAVFQRDNYTCVWCNKSNIYFHADHIKPFAYFPELRFEGSNGQTLCANCHKWKTKMDMKVWRSNLPGLNIIYAS